MTCQATSHYQSIVDPYICGHVVLLDHNEFTQNMRLDPLILLTETRETRMANRAGISQVDFRFRFRFNMFYS